MYTISNLYIIIKSIYSAAYEIIPLKVVYNKLFKILQTVYPDIINIHITILLVVFFVLNAYAVCYNYYDMSIIGLLLLFIIYYKNLRNYLLAV